MVILLCLSHCAMYPNPRSKYLLARQQSAPSTCERFQHTEKGASTLRYILLEKWNRSVSCCQVSNRNWSSECLHPSRPFSLSHYVDPQECHRQCFVAGSGTEPHPRKVGWSTKWCLCKHDSGTRSECAKQSVSLLDSSQWGLYKIKIYKFLDFSTNN